MKAQELKAGVYIVEVGKGGKTKVAPLNQAASNAKPKRQATTTAGGTKDEKPKRKFGGGGGKEKDRELWEVIGYAVYESKAGNKMRVAILWIIDGKNGKKFATGNVKYRIAWTVGKDGAPNEGFVKDTRFDVWSHQVTDSGAPRLSEIELIENWEQVMADNKVRRDAEYQAQFATEPAA